MPKKRDPQQPAATPRLAKLLKPADQTAAARRLIDEYAAAARNLTAAELVESERRNRASGLLPLAAVAHAEIERRAKGAQ